MPALPDALIEAATYRRGRLDVFDCIDPPRTALLVVDMQNAWLAPGAPFETPAARALIPVINRLADALRRRGGLVMWIQHTTGAPGTADYWALYFDNFIADDKRVRAVAALVAGSPLHALHPDLDVRGDDMIVRKYRFSLLARNPHDPEKMLRERGIDTVIVVGAATNMCCESTVRDAMMRDFRVFMPHDAVAAPREDGHAAGLRSVMQSFADIRSADVVIDLIETSETPA